MKNDTILEVLFTENVPHERGADKYLSYFNLDGDYAKTLAQKNLLLVGGGQSPVLDDLLERKVRPNSVVNIDPYAKRPDNLKQKLISEDFFDHQITPNNWDEIWALYSLPTYCDKVSQIRTFYAKSLLGLAPHGNLRVYPINHSFSGKVNSWKRLNGEPAEPKNVEHEEVLWETREFMLDMACNFPEVKTREYNYSHKIEPGVDLTIGGKKSKLAPGKLFETCGKVAQIIAPADKRALNAYLEKML